MQYSPFDLTWAISTVQTVHGNSGCGALPQLSFDLLSKNTKLSGENKGEIRVQIFIFSKKEENPYFSITHLLVFSFLRPDLKRGKDGARSLLRHWEESERWSPLVILCKFVWFSCHLLLVVVLTCFVVVFLLFFFLDLLYKDYHTDQKFTLSTYTSENVVWPFSFLCIKFIFWAISFFVDTSAMTIAIRV